MAEESPKSAETTRPEFFRSIVEAQSDFVTRFLPSGVVTYCNPAVGRAFGIPPEAFIGRPWHGHVSNPAELERALASLRQLTKDTPVVWNETSIRLPNGEVRWLEWENRAIFDHRDQIAEIQAVGRDITARVRAESDLRESQATLKSFFEGSQMFMAVIELRGESLVGVQANRAVARHLALPSTNVEELGAAEVGVPSGIHSLWVEKCRQAREEGRPIRFVYERPLGQQLRVLDATVEHVGDSPTGSRFSMVASDQTAQAQADSLKAFSEQLLANTHEAVFTTNRDFKIVRWNQGAEEVFGWSAPEAAGQNFCTLLRVRSSEGLDMMNIVLNSNRFDGDVECDKKDGSTVYVDARSAAMRDSNGALLGLIVSARDVTSKKEAELALRESEERLSTIFREAHAAIAILDLRTGSILDANPAFSEMFRWSREEVLGKTPKSLDLWADLEERELLRKRMLEGIRLAEVSLRRRSGEVIECLVSMNPTRLEDIPCLIAVVQDISELRNAERQLRIAVQERDTLLREIHHRVKNNLQVLSSLIRLQLQREPLPTGREVGTSLLERIQAMSVVHERLYAHERLDTVSAASYLTDLTRAVLETHPDVISRVSVDVEVEPVDISIEVAMRLGLIIGELVTNALKHAFPDGREGELKIRMARDAKGVVLAVGDDGIGLAAGLESPRARSMGLELARQLAAQLGATLEVESCAGTKWVLRVAEV
ncbi:MAG: PAS domain S-box protein [Deltaproteobacteria bacterium]|nr:PAS domain S-box protein [Deltaproteobacteria bacterium]